MLLSIFMVNAPAGAFAAPAGDPVEGLWLGSAGSVRERIEVGLDFRRDAQGGLKVFLTQPISNSFGSEMQGTVRREGEQVVLDEIALSLRLEGDRLEGTFPGPNSPASFHRVSELPAPAPIPEVPAGPSPVWQTRLNGQVFASPVVLDGKVYIGTTGGVLSAVDARTGKILWSFAAGRPILGGALVSADAVFFTCDNGYLFRLRRDDGKEVWRYDLGDSRVSRVLGHPEVFDWDWHGATPVLADGTISTAGRSAPRSSWGTGSSPARPAALPTSFHTPRASRCSTAPPASSCAASPCPRSPAPTSGASPAHPPSPETWWSSRR